jgi:hypothetical protein
VAWDARLAHYSRLAQELKQQPRLARFGFLAVDGAAIAAAAQREALAWLKAVFRAMRDMDLGAVQVRFTVTLSYQIYQPRPRLENLL